MATELRSARTEDRDAIRGVFGAARRAALAYLPLLHSEAENRAYFVELIDRDSTTVAVLDDSVVGFVTLGAARVEHLYVDPAHWRRGVGTLLLRHAQGARPAGVDLWVFQRNAAAIAFYERHGFRIAETSDGAGNEEREPDARMVWPGAGG